MNCSLKDKLTNSFFKYHYTLHKCIVSYKKIFLIKKCSFNFFVSDLFRKKILAGKKYNKNFIGEQKINKKNRHYFKYIYKINDFYFSH